MDIIWLVLLCSLSFALGGALVHCYHIDKCPKFNVFGMKRKTTTTNTIRVPALCILEEQNRMRQERNQSLLVSEHSQQTTPNTQPLFPSVPLSEPSTNQMKS